MNWLYAAYTLNILVLIPVALTTLLDGEIGNRLLTADLMKHGSSKPEPTQDKQIRIDSDGS